MQPIPKHREVPTIQDKRYFLKKLYVLNNLVYPLSKIKI